MNYLWFILTHFMPYAIWVFLYHYFAGGFFFHIRVSNKNEWVMKNSAAVRRNNLFNMRLLWWRIKNETRLKMTW